MPANILRDDVKAVSRAFSSIGWRNANFLSASGDGKGDKIAFRNRTHQDAPNGTLLFSLASSALQG
jgi:hypothetical protein